MSPCQHGWHGEGGTGLSQHPVCPFACPGTQPTPSTAAIKLFIVTLIGVAPLWGHRGGHGGLWGPGDSRESVPPSAALPSLEGKGDGEGRNSGRGEVGTLLGRAGIPFPRRRAWGSRWQQAGKRLRPHGNGPSCEEMGWEEPGSGGDSAVPAGPAAVSVWGHWDPHGHCGGCWRSGVTPQRWVRGTPKSRESGACPLWGPWLWWEVTRAGLVPAVLGLGTAGSSARPPDRALGVSVRDSPALDGGGDPPEGYKPLIAGWDCRGGWKPWEQQEVSPPSFLAVG